MKKVLCIVVALNMLLPLSTYASENPYWKKEDGQWYLYSSDTKLYGFQNVNGSTYYLDDNGIMTCGWALIDGCWYYFDNNGAMYINRWKESYYLRGDGKMETNAWIGPYYVDQTGKYVQGWKLIDDNWYYFMPQKGNCSIGWKKINGLWYYFNNTGIMQTGFLEDNGSIYYLNNSMKKGWVCIDSIWYYFMDNGSMATSKWIGNYYLNADGKMAVNTWIDSYYVDENGKYNPSIKRYDWKHIGQRWRLYDRVNSTYIESSWMTIDHKQYYFDENGDMVTGWLNYAGKYYYLDSCLQTGWVKVNGFWYLLGSDGAMLTGWQKVESYWYYMYENGKMASNTTIDGYWLGSNGRYMKNYYDGILVVNKKHPLPSGYESGENPEAGKAIRRMIVDMQNLGYNIGSNYSGYRSYSTQYSLYWNYVNAYGQVQADTFSARPGYSEHQTGLAFDLMHRNGALVEGIPEVNWIKKNAHKYGFIVRYHSGKEAITGYVAEPWHLRYVGNKATSIYNSGLTLEEYLGVSGGGYE